MGLLGKVAGYAVKKVAEQAGLALLDAKLDKDYKKNTTFETEQCRWLVKQQSSKPRFDIFDEHSEKVYFVKKARNGKRLDFYDLNENEVGSAWVDWNPFSKRTSYSVNCGKHSGTIESKPSLASSEYECDMNHWKISQNVIGTQITITKPKGGVIFIQHSISSLKDGYADYYVVNGPDKKDMLISIIIAMAVRECKK